VDVIGVRQARAGFAALIEQAADGEAVVIARHGKPAAALLPPEAVELWERHLAEKAEHEARAAREKQLAAVVPEGRTPCCPVCKGSYMAVVLSGPVIHALVNVADPAAGVQAVTVNPDRMVPERVEDVWCASCQEPMGSRPREHGHPAYREALAIEEAGSYPEPWELGDAYGRRTSPGAPSAARIVLAHDIARGHVELVSRWEWLTGITDAERERMREEADGLPEGWRIG
jgi:prevent-host-death family protein